MARMEVMTRPPGQGRASQIEDNASEAVGAGETPPVYRRRQYPEPFPTGHYTAGGVTVGVFFLRKLPHMHGICH